MALASPDVAVELERYSAFVVSQNPGLTVNPAITTSCEGVRFSVPLDGVNEGFYCLFFLFCYESRAGRNPHAFGGDTVPEQEP